MFFFKIEGGELFFFFSSHKKQAISPDTVLTKESPECDKCDSLIICKFISLIIQNFRYSAVLLCCQNKETVCHVVFLVQRKNLVEKQVAELQLRFKKYQESP